MSAKIYSYSSFNRTYGLFFTKKLVVVICSISCRILIGFVRVFPVEKIVLLIDELLYSWHWYAITVVSVDYACRFTSSMVRWVIYLKALHVPIVYGGNAPNSFCSVTLFRSYCLLIVSLCWPYNYPTNPKTKSFRCFSYTLILVLF